MNDFNVSINPESLDEKGKEILAQFKVINDAINEIENAKQNLASWQSQNKDKYEAKIVNALPKMREIAEVISSYGSVAQITSRAILNTEEKISRVLE